MLYQLRYAVAATRVWAWFGVCASTAIAQSTQPGSLPTPPWPSKQAQTIPAQIVALPSTPPAATDASASKPIATPQLVAWLTSLIHENLPPSYEDDRKWGKQKEVWDGVKIWREGARIETKRRKKMVNAGTWTRYRIRIVEPDKRLHVQFNRLEALPDGRIAFGVTVECPLDVFGRLSHWVRDVQLISLSANADAACRLTLEGTVKFQLNPLKLPPDVSIRPRVDRAHIELTYYRVRRISQIGGDFAKHLGNGLRDAVDNKLEDMNAKLVDKINRQLEKRSDRLNFSVQDWLRSKLPLPEASGP